MSNLGLGQSVGDFQEITLTPGAALNAFVLPVLDVSLFKSFSLQLTGVWNANVQIQVGNDKQNFSGLYVTGPNPSFGPFTNISTNGVYFGQISYRYIQIQITAYTSGTVTGVLELYTIAPPSNIVALVNPSVVLAAGTNSIGSLNTARSTSIAAGTAANTVIKGTPGTFYGVFASTTAAGAGQIFDNATTPAGTPVGVAPTAIGYLPGVPSVGVECVNGITVQGSATNPALTVFWR